MGVTAGGVVGVKGEVGVRGEVGAVGVGVAGLRPLLYRGALCLNCDGSAGLGVLGSSGCRLASREDGAISRVRPGEGPAGQGPPTPRECGQALTAGARSSTTSGCGHKLGAPPWRQRSRAFPG